MSFTFEDTEICRAEECLIALATPLSQADSLISRAEGCVSRGKYRTPFIRSTALEDAYRLEEMARRLRAMVAQAQSAPKLLEAAE